MNYFRLPDAIVDRVEKWEHHYFYGDAAVFSDLPLRYRLYTITWTVAWILITLYICTPLLLGLVLVSMLPLSQTGQWLGMMLYALTIIIVSIISAIRLWRRGHRI